MALATDSLSKEPCFWSSRLSAGLTGPMHPFADSSHLVISCSGPHLVSSLAFSPHLILIKGPFLASLDAYLLHQSQLKRMKMELATSSNSFHPASSCFTVVLSAPVHCKPEALHTFSPFSYARATSISSHRLSVDKMT